MYRSLCLQELRIVSCGFGLIGQRSQRGKVRFSLLVFIRASRERVRARKPTGHPHPFAQHKESKPPDPHERAPTTIPRSVRSHVTTLYQVATSYENQKYASCTEYLTTNTNRDCGCARGVYRVCIYFILRVILVQQSHSPNESSTLQHCLPNYSVEQTFRYDTLIARGYSQGM